MLKESPHYEGSLAIPYSSRKEQKFGFMQTELYLSPAKQDGFILVLPNDTLYNNHPSPNAFPADRTLSVNPVFPQNFQIKCSVQLFFHV